MTTIFSSILDELAAAHEVSGGYIINFYDAHRGQGYLLLDDDTAIGWSVPGRYPAEVWEQAGWIEENINTHTSRNQKSVGER